MKPTIRTRALGVLALLVAVAVPAGLRSDQPPATDVIVRAAPGAMAEARSLVERVGGTPGTELALIEGFTAVVPTGALQRLVDEPAVIAVTPDATVRLTGSGWEAADDDELEDHAGNLWEVVRRIRADRMWDDGHTGAGVDVALIDSGVLPVRGLTAQGKIVNGPDLSFESIHPSLRYLDTYGHGTHMAGIIAGRDPGIDLDEIDVEDGEFAGVAPDARIISIKVADAHGVTDVSQVIAAIDWVVQHRNVDGLDIRVLNLSFGTDSVQSYELDPLAYAVEQAWQNGIVVVVAAGNDGNASDLRDPANDPFVIAVGALDSNGTTNRDDDEVAEFSNCGTEQRHVDVIAPGRSIVSLRAPGSYADAENPKAVVGKRFFLGSGTSQAAAVVSGVAALLIDENPDLTPDEVKAIIGTGARPLGEASPRCQGEGVVDANVSAQLAVPASAEQPYSASTGLGSLDAARGSDRITADGVELKGEIDIHGTPWDAASWTEAAADLESWDDGTWNGVTWSGSDWTGVTWSGVTWSIDSWEGVTWSGVTWSGVTWSGVTWSGASWSGVTWSGGSWSESSWSGVTWSGVTWSGVTWSGAAWLGSSTVAL